MTSRCSTTGSRFYELKNVEKSTKFNETKEPFLPIKLLRILPLRRWWSIATWRRNDVKKKKETSTKIFAHRVVDKPNVVEPLNRLNHPYSMMSIVDLLSIWNEEKNIDECFVFSDRTIQWIQMNSRIVGIIGNFQRWFRSSCTWQRILNETRKFEFSSIIFFVTNLNLSNF